MATMGLASAVHTTPGLPPIQGPGRISGVRSETLRIKPGDGDGGRRGDGVLDELCRAGMGAERSIAGGADCSSSRCSINLDVLRVSCIRGGGASWAAVEADGSRLAAGAARGVWSRSGVGGLGRTLLKGLSSLASE
jgi:hypothetical protein